MNFKRQCENAITIAKKLNKSKEITVDYGDFILSEDRKIVTRAITIKIKDKGNQIQSKQ